MPFRIRVEPVRIGKMTAELVYPPNVSTDRVLLFLHGGGYCLGTARMYRDLAARLAIACNGQTLAINYRLAPEHVFPAALEDSLEAYKWLIRRNYKPQNIVVAGDSAGGGLAIATVFKLREESFPLPAAVVCLSPWTDLACTGESIKTNADRDPWLHPQGLLELASLYIQQHSPLHPLISPLYGDFTGFPPLLIQVGTEEILLDDAKRLAECARSAGADVTLEVWQDMWHVWQTFATVLPDSRRAINNIAEFLQKYL